MKTAKGHQLDNCPCLNVCSDGVMKYIEHRGASKNSIKNKVFFPGGSVVENLPANAGDTGSSPGPGRSHMPRSN